MRGNTVLAQPSDSGMIRVDEETDLGVAVSTDCNGRFAKLDPYAGAQLALAEAYRNVATGGATPLAISDCLNFGSPEDPGVMWQFAEACRGLKDACVELGIPVTGGNVSLYNQTGETAILPDPGGRGARRDRRRHPAHADRLRRPRASGCSCSARPARSCPARSGRTSSTATSAACRRGSTWPPSGRSPSCCREAVGLVTSAHDLSDGGLAQALVESALRHGVGAAVALEGDPFVALFSESAGRVLVTVRTHDADQARRPRSAARRDLDPAGPHRRRRRWSVEGLFEVPLDELRAAWTTTLASPSSDDPPLRRRPEPVRRAVPSPPASRAASSW